MHIKFNKTAAFPFWIYLWWVWDDPKVPDNTQYLWQHHLSHESHVTNLIFKMQAQDSDVRLQGISTVS